MVNGDMVWLKAVVVSHIVMETCMKESGATIKLMAMEFIRTPKVLTMKATSKMT